MSEVTKSEYLTNLYMPDWVKSAIESNLDLNKPIRGKITIEFASGEAVLYFKPIIDELKCMIQSNSTSHIATSEGVSAYRESNLNIRRQLNYLVSAINNY